MDRISIAYNFTLRPCLWQASLVDTYPGGIIFHQCEKEVAGQGSVSQRQPSQFGADLQTIADQLSRNELGKTVSECPVVQVGWGGLGHGFPDGFNRYDGNNPDPHPHVIFVKCRKIIERQLGHFEKVHPGYAAGVRPAMADREK